ncbi:class I SAM-dependent methyltransferase [Limibacter armeniacum]|uniref:class I SAM-dependent methyltransferase n=1 Tax=Limibacter armeniacum TaxID=466084 RepID=UPI002FE50CBD
MNQSSKTSFDFLAPYYDRLARIVFGKHIVNVQLDLLSELRANDKVLIVGGGTGWILPEIFDRYPAIQVTYVEASPKMVAQAKAKLDLELHSQVQFVVATHQIVKEQSIYDAVITFFFLDVLQESEQSDAIQKLGGALKKGGKWLLADFQLRKGVHFIWQWVLLQLMLFFFKITSNLHITRLPSFENLFDQHEYKHEVLRTYFAGMIFGKSLKKL